MRAYVELDHGLHPGAWAARHSRGEVPDQWPYGLDRLAHYGVHPHMRAPVSGRRLRRLARAASAKGGGADWVDGAAALFDPDHRQADVVLCWTEHTGVPAILREAATRGRPVATGVVWLTDHDGVAPVAARLARWALPRAATVWVSSSAMVPRLREDWKVPASRAHWVPLGIDTAFFTPSTYPPLEQEPLVVSAGNDRHRDHALLVRAVADLRRTRPDVRLALATRLPVDMPDGLGTVARGLDEAGVAALYSRSSVVAVATRPNVHASGLTVTLEAMASARPVVATGTPGMSDYVEHGVTGFLVPPGDERALSRAIGDLVADPEAAAAMGKAGRERVESQFSTELQASRLADLLRTLA